MASKGLIIGLAAVAAVGVAAVVMSSKPAEATGEFLCPYGDGQVFTTITALQDHVLAVHPGQPIPLDIRLE